MYLHSCTLLRQAWLKNAAICSPGESDLPTPYASLTALQFTVFELSAMHNAGSSIQHAAMQHAYHWWIAQVKMEQSKADNMPRTSPETACNTHCSAVLASWRPACGNPVCTTRRVDGRTWAPPASPAAGRYAAPAARRGRAAAGRRVGPPASCPVRRPAGGRRGLAPAAARGRASRAAAGLRIWPVRCSKRRTSRRCRGRPASASYTGTPAGRQSRPGPRRWG